MTLFAYLNGSDVGYRVRLNAFGLTSRADGAPGMGGIIFDDPDKTLTVRGWMSVVVKETACTSAPVLFSGYVGPRTYSRSDGSRTYRTASGRFINCNLVDHNVVAAIRLITGADGKRPAETHNARLTWLLNSAYMSGLIADTSLIDTSNPRPFEEADYRGQFPDNVLEDIAGPIFRSFFVYLTQPTGGRGLFFDVPAATVSTSTLTVSNVYTDQSATCFPPSIDAELNRDPSEVIAKVRFTYAHGTVIENNTTTRDTFFLDNGLGYRGLQVDNSRVGLESTARSMAQQILTRNSTEKDTLTFAVQLPAASVGLIRAGQRLGVRFTHLDGYETLQYARVVMCNYAQAPDTDAVYDVTLELSNSGLSSTGGGGAPSPGDFPHSSSPPSIVQQVSGTGNLVMPSAITAGNTLLYIGGKRTAAFTQLSGLATYTAVQAQTGNPQYVGMFYKVAGAGESTTLNIAAEGLIGGTWYELPGTWTPDTMDADTSSTVNLVSGPITAAANAITFAVSAQGRGGAYDSVAATLSYTPGSGWTEDGDMSVSAGAPNIWTAHRLDSGSLTASATNSGNGGLSGTDYDWAMQVASFTGAVGNDPPAPGQWIYNELPAMAGAVGTLDFGYASGSLRIRVDGVPISSASITETNPAAGTFTLSWAPDSDEVVRVDYQGI